MKERQEREKGSAWWRKRHEAAHPACHLAVISGTIPPFRPQIGYLISRLIIIAISHIFPSDRGEIVQPKAALLEKIL